MCKYNNISVYIFDFKENNTDPEHGKFFHIFTNNNYVVKLRFITSSGKIITFNIDRAIAERRNEIENRRCELEELNPINEHEFIKTLTNYIGTKLV